jgi:hypothetical protein
MKKAVIIVILSMALTSCMTTYSRVGNCKYKYRPSLQNASWRHLKSI